MADKHRVAKIEKAIAKEIAEALVTTARDPRNPVVVTVTRVECTKDLSRARIYWSMLGSEGQRRTAERMFVDSRGFFQTLIAKRFDTRTVPQISFHYDEEHQKRLEIESLIDEALAEDRKSASRAEEE